MMLTEDDAKRKACCKCMPHKPDGQLMTAACLASACMAWRWLGEDYDTDEGESRGYCGLAGSPK